jgi:hypothetical protein
MQTLTEMVELRKFQNYTLQNNDIPITFQKLPILAEIGLYLYNQNISLINCRTREDYFYYMLALIVKDSIINKSKGFGNLLNQERFFQILEDVFHYFFDISGVRAYIYSVNKKEKKIKKIEKKYGYFITILEFLKKYNPDLNIWDVLKIRQHDSKISIKTIPDLYFVSSKIKEKP